MTTTTDVYDGDGDYDLQMAMATLVLCVHLIIHFVLTERWKVHKFQPEKALELLESQTKRNEQQQINNNNN